MFTLIPTNVLTALCGALAILCYALFSRSYEHVIRHDRANGQTAGKDYSGLYSAILLYGGAAAILFILALVSYLFLGWNFGIPAPADVFGHVFSRPIEIKWVLAGLVLTMSVLYAIHIVTEASARRTINMGAYALVFQVYVLVIAMLDWAIYRAEPQPSVLIGGIILLVVGLVVSAAQVRAQAALERERRNAAQNPKQRQAALERKRRRHQHRRRARIALRHLFTPTSRAVRLGLASAVACGAALYVDGEIGRNYILKGRLERPALSVFLGYEMLTFLIPAIWSFLLLTLRRRRTGRPALGGVARAVWDEFRPRGKGYLFASLCSAGQFVFSVLALSLPGPRFVPAMVLAAGPGLTVLFDLNLRKRGDERGKEVALAVIGAIGFFLVLVK